MAKLIDVLRQGIRIEEFKERREEESVRCSRHRSTRKQSREKRADQDKTEKRGDRSETRMHKRKRIVFDM